MPPVRRAALGLDGWTGRKLGAKGLLAAEDGWIWTAGSKQYGRQKQPPIWLVTGGRGAGKTRLGSEWVNCLARGWAPFAGEHERYASFALVGETLSEVREVMVDGPSGIRALVAWDRPRFETSRRRLVWDRSGAVAHCFSSEDPEALRGPQFAAAWCDELAKWKHAQATWDMLQFGMRLGEKPRQLVTTTPRPTPLFKRLLGEPGVLVTTMRSEENAANLAPGFLGAVRERFRGTRLERQELDGELVEDREGALWNRALLERAFLREPPAMRRIVVAVDPPASSRKSSDACGIVAAGRDAEGGIVVLADATVRAAEPAAWATAAVGLYRRLEADAIVAEVNQGGDMVTAVIRTVDAAVPVRPVRATRGKWVRAEPVAALYAQGRVRHAGRFPDLEDEMCDFGPDGMSGGRSPDRVDALVWAVTELMRGDRAQPRVRELG